MKKIFWIAGEVSGDLHAGMILKKLDKKYINYGIGGDFMQKEGFTPLYDFHKFSVMGFIEVLKNIGFFIRVKKEIEAHLANEKPDLVILVDYPGLNMRIAKAAKMLGIPVIFYIAPQFWAWKYKRVYDLKKFTDITAVIFPFEDKILKSEDVNSKFVGHPIAEEISVSLDKENFAKKFELDINKKWITFFPGSRINEVKRMLPVFEKAINLLENHEFIISQSPNLADKYFKNIKNAKVVKGYNYELMKYSFAMSITSGTATLEVSYIGTPFLIAYKTTKTSYMIGKYFIKTKWIGLPNIVLSKSAVKELIQDDANEQNIAAELNNLINNIQYRNKMKSDFEKIKKMLGTKSASDEMKKIISGFLDE